MTNIVSLPRRCTNRKYAQLNSTAGKIIADDQTAELGETSTAAMMKSASREGEMETGRSDNAEKSHKLVKVGGGYRRDWPPEDDCCPICFDDFHVPCRTSCGHWFCSGCFMLLWRYMAKFKQCVCPICKSLIFNLIPHPSALLQPGEEVSKILEEIQRYNSQNMVGWFGIFKKAVALPQPTPRRVITILQSIRLILHTMRVILLLHRHGYFDLYDFYLFHDGGPMLFFICTFALLMYVIWKRSVSLRRQRQLAEQNLIG